MPARSVSGSQEFQTVGNVAGKGLFLMALKRARAAGIRSSLATPS